MKVQGNRYINNPEMIKNKVEKKTTVPQNIISEDDVKISDSARKLVETARNKVSDFHTMHFSSINGEIREIPAEYKCENLFKLDLKFADLQHFWHTVFPCQYCVHNQHFLNHLYIHPCNSLMHNHTGQIQPNIFLLFVTFFSHCGKLWNADLLSYMNKN